jgi:four helix bundle protein
MVISFRELSVWQKSVELALQVYSRTANFPRSETYGLSSQMRRAAVSIPSNVAEGKAIGGRSYPRHLKIALGSESELETQIELSRRLAWMTTAEAEELMASTSEVGRMLAGLLKALPRD